MKSLGIIWNSAYDFKDDIVSDMSQVVKVDGCYHMDLGDDYEKFVRTLYSFDDIADWKVDSKLKAMFFENPNRKVCVVIFNFDADQTFYHAYKKRSVFSQLENLKGTIRGEYSKKVPCYFFDNVFHASDNAKEFEQDYNLFLEYYKKYGFVPDTKEKGKTKVYISGENKDES